MTRAKHCVARVIAAAAIPVFLGGDALAGDDWVEVDAYVVALELIAVDDRVGQAAALRGHGTVGAAPAECSGRASFQRDRRK